MSMEKILNWCRVQLEAAMTNIVPALVFFVIGLLAIRIVMALVNKLLEKTKLEKAAHGLIKSVARVVLFVLLGLIVADALGIDVALLLSISEDEKKLK